MERKTEEVGITLHTNRFHSTICSSVIPRLDSPTYSPIDIRMSLKGRLPMFMLQAKAIELYERYSELKREAGETPEQLTINKSWVQRWATERHISLRCPNKRFSISQDARKRRIIQFLMNMWEVRRFWLHHYKREPDKVTLS